MAKEEARKKTDEARALMDSFAERTGLRNGEKNKNKRYLWTDAVAVKTFFGLFHIYKNERYREDAYHLIELVHDTLGKYHPQDKRSGRLSGLPEQEGKLHPTAGGLRIGKKLPERKEGEAVNERLEWERDGQYFHYNTRWINTLLLAARESRDDKYSVWAADLLKAGEKFIYSSSMGLRMYWKMSSDLSRPLVPGMGGHDPLEGVICALNIKESIPEKAIYIQEITAKFQQMCKNKNWSTSDSLGLGGLLLNTLKASKLSSQKELPPSTKPADLLEECIDSLENYVQQKEITYPAHRRLAFRECGLSLGLRALEGSKEKNYLANKDVGHDRFKEYWPLANSIEEFWLKNSSQKASTWTEHLDINSVSLAASLVAKEFPSVYS